MERLSRCGRALVELDVGGSGVPLVPAVRAVARNCPVLRRLSLRGARNASADGALSADDAKTLARTFPVLTHVDLGLVPDLTLEVLAVVVRDGAKLRHFDVAERASASRARHTRREGLRARGHTSVRREVILSNADRTRRAIVEPRSRYDRNEAIDDDFLRALFRGTGDLALETLGLSWCEALKGAGLADIASRCPDLQRLEARVRDRSPRSATVARTNERTHERERDVEGSSAAFFCGATSGSEASPLLGHAGL